MKTKKACPYAKEKDSEGLIPPCTYSSFEGELCEVCDGGVFLNQKPIDKPHINKLPTEFQEKEINPNFYEVFKRAVADGKITGIKLNSSISGKETP